MAASGQSCRRSGHDFPSQTDPDLTPSVHRSKSVVPEGTTLRSERFSETDMGLGVKSSSARNLCIVNVSVDGIVAPSRIAVGKRHQ
jgi:hypothetical protein